MTHDVPDSDELRAALAEQTPLLTQTPTPEVVAVRVHRVLGAAGDLLDLPGERGDQAAVREIVARTLMWVAEHLGAYHRLPAAYAEGRRLEGDRTPLLSLVDELDLLGLTLDHAYDAAHRQAADDLARQLRVVTDTFPSGTDVTHLVTPTEPAADPEVAARVGAEVGADGIPRMPVPEQPDPRHVREDT